MSTPIQRLIKHKFQKMFLEDKLYTALPNLDSWIHTTFNKLNRMEKTHGKKSKYHTEEERKAKNGNEQMEHYMRNKEVLKVKQRTI